MSEHRVSMLGSSLRRFEDPESSSDPRVRALVGALKNVDYAPAPDAQFRAELRAQLVAVAPRIISESAPAATDAAPASVSRVRALSDAKPLSAQVRKRRFVRPLAIAGGVAAAFLIILGGAVWMSQKALPGDSLYGLKRASENVQLSLTSGGTDRGHEYLSLAQTRVEEARELLQRNSAAADGTGTLSGGLSQHTADLIASNLASADSDVRNGSDLLNTQAVKSRSQSPLDIMTGWAPGQLNRLKDLASALPTGSLQRRTQTSWTLTDTALTRSKALVPAIASGCKTSGTTDPLGPLPICAGATSSPTSPATVTPRSGSTGHPAAPKHSGSAGTAHASTGGTATPKTPATSTPTSGAPAPSSSPVIPGLPNLLPTKPPLTINSCGISVAVGPIGIGVGSCPSSS